MAEVSQTLKNMERKIYNTRQYVTEIGGNYDQ